MRDGMRSYRVDARPVTALRGAAIAAVWVIAFIVPALAPAQTYSVLFPFPGGTSGAFPFGTVSRDKKGTVFGTTYNTDGTGDGAGSGVLYMISPSGSETVLHTFLGAPNDGANPKGGVIHSNSIIYGTTTYGGNSTKCSGGCGVVYTVTLGGRETILHNFAGGTDGANPYGTLILDSSNDVYGTTEFGGSTACPQGCGIIFEVTAAGKEIIAHKFTGADGKYPQAGLYLSGTVAYGTTTQGGASGFGTVYKIDTTGKLTTLYSFEGGDDGAGPSGPVIQDTSGNLYGATYNGGGSTKCPGGCGALFKIDSSGKESVVYVFTGGADGANPRGTLTMDSQGNLFGVTNAGGQGSPGLGVIFELNTQGVESVVHTFTGGADGQNPYGGLARDAYGNVYGAAVYGGDSGCEARGCGLTFTAHP
jgi:uncharacterized repeat protein (TIGR03803 family)